MNKKTVHARTKLGPACLTESGECSRISSHCAACKLHPAWSSRKAQLWSSSARIVSSVIAPGPRCHHVSFVPLPQRLSRSSSARTSLLMQCTLMPPEFTEYHGVAASCEMTTSRATCASLRACLSTNRTAFAPTRRLSMAADYNSGNTGSPPLTTKTYANTRMPAVTIPARRSVGCKS